MEEPKSKHQKNDTDQDVETESEEEDRNNPFEEQAKDLFQNSHIIVTSKETSTGGRLNLAVRRAKPNQGGSTMGCRKLKSKWQLSPKEKNYKKKAAVAVEDLQKSKPAETINTEDQPSSSGGLDNAKTKQSKKRIFR